MNGDTVTRRQGDRVTRGQGIRRGALCHHVTPSSGPQITPSIWRDTRGQSLLLQTLLIVPALMLVIGLVFDLGAVALAQVQAQTAVDLAVQDAAKYIDWGTFYVTQELVLMDEAFTVATHRVTEYSAGHVEILQLTVIPYTLDNRHYQGLYLVGQVDIPTRYLHLIGLPHIYRRVQALAVPAYGIAGVGN